VSKNRDWALDRLADLSADYNSIFGELLAATDSSRAATVKEEQRLGEDICFYGRVAFGKATAEQLYLMRPVRPDELAEMRTLGIIPPDTPQQIASGLSVCSTAATLPLVGTRAKSEEHKQAMMACIWRGWRLSALLREADNAPPRGKQKRLYGAYLCIKKERPEADESEWRQEARKAVGGTAADMRRAINRYG
jgi:hypothetical protein